MAREWCRRHGYELDPVSYEDLGVSGFSGANKDKGALGALLKAAHDGEIESGSILLIEAFDRLTRTELTESVPLLMNIVNAGITIVTLVDQKVWTKAAMADMTNFIYSVVLLSRAHEEVSRKSGMVKKAYRDARRAGSQSVFGTAPGWLYREHKNAPWQVNEQLAQSVRKVFQYAINGYGSKNIAKIANKEGWPVPTRLNLTAGQWHGQMAGGILRNRAVLGEHEHRITTHDARKRDWRGLATGEVIKDYYPRIIDDDVWYAARAAIEARATDKRRDSHYFNIFSGLMFCGYCGAPIHRKSELASGRKPSLVCSHKLPGRSKEKCKTTSAPNTDIPILWEIWNFARVLNLPGVGGPIPGQTTDIIELEARLVEKQAEAERIADAIATGAGGSRTLQRRLLAVEAEAEEAETELETKKRERAATNSANIFDEDYTELAKYIECLYVAHDDEARDMRAKLHVKLRRLIEYVWIWGYEVALVKLKEHDYIFHVELDERRNPGKVKPNAPYHTPVQKRRAKHKPFLELARKGELVPPAPKLTVNMNAQKKASYVAAEDEEELEE